MAAPWGSDGKRDCWHYKAPAAVCQACPLKVRCTQSKSGRVILRHRHQELLDQARRQAKSPAAWKDYHKRQWLIEGSFGEAANQHHFRRSRWRRLWRQRIQHYLIATIQNIKTYVKNAPYLPKAPGIALGVLAEPLSWLKTAPRNRFLKPWAPLEP